MNSTTVPRIQIPDTRDILSVFSTVSGAVRTSDSKNFHWLVSGSQYTQHVTNKKNNVETADGRPADETNESQDQKPQTSHVWRDYVTQ